MIDQIQSELLDTINDVDAFRILVADLHDDLVGKVARFRQLADLSVALGSLGTLMPGGETASAAWTEARSSFVHGNYVATVLLCQGLAVLPRGRKHGLALFTATTLRLYCCVKVSPCCRVDGSTV